MRVAILPAMCRPLRLWLAAPLISALMATPAQATYSLLIADRATGLIGSIGTSCVGRQRVSAISGIAPGYGAIHAQAASNPSGRDRAVMMLRSGASADDVIAAITAPNFDLLAATRQYGVVTLAGSAAGYTGSSNGTYADDRQMTFGDYVTSYQGNILTSARVLEQLEESLSEAEGCDLPDTLMRALEAGAREGEGDSRCTPRGIPADSGFLKVVDREGKVLISLEVTDQSTDGALVPLRAQFDAWRTTHRCPTEVDAGIVMDAASVEDASARSDGKVPTDEPAPSESDTEPPVARVDAATAYEGNKDAGKRDAQRDGEPTASRDNSGCSAARFAEGSWLLALVGLALRNRSRRQERMRRAT
jgi:uncharacterized Ntn-hydrolase superfamily protein